MRPGVRTVDSGTIRYGATAADATTAPAGSRTASDSSGVDDGTGEHDTRSAAHREQGGGDTDADADLVRAGTRRG